MMGDVTPTINVFYCYAHEDKALRDELAKHLSLLIRSGRIRSWYDREILAGEKWEEKIDTHLDAAHLILLLISPDFMHSDYCYGKEMRRAIERHQREEAHVIPILLRPIYWKGAPFSTFQMLPTNAEAVTRWPNRDEALENIAQGIAEAVENVAITLEKGQRPKAEDAQDEGENAQAGAYEQGMAYSMNVFDPSAEDQSSEADLQFIIQMLEMRATTATHLLPWTMCSKMLTYILQRLDPHPLGMSVTLVQCMPPTREQRVCSLRSTWSIGTPPWSGRLEPQYVLQGAGSLAGEVVTSCHSDSVPDFETMNVLSFAEYTEYERSAAAFPLLFANNIAGCLYVASTQSNYFSSKERLSLMQSYALVLGLALGPEEFYPPDMIALRVMPPRDVQRAHFATFQQRVMTAMKQPSKEFYHSLTKGEAERLVWTHIEDELLRLSSDA